MFKSKQKLLNISLFLAALMLLSACGGNMIKPIRKDVIGHSTVRNITVISPSSIASNKVMDKVKKAVRERANSELKGNIKVDLKVTIDKWSGTDNVVGGSTTKTLFGSKTLINAVIDIIDSKTKEVIGKYTIYAEYKEGGLLAASKTLSFIDTEETVIDQFARSTIYHLE